MTTRTLFPGPITLDTLPDLLAFHRARFGGYSMKDDDGSDGSGSDGGGGDAGSGGDGDGNGNGDGGNGGSGGDGSGGGAGGGSGDAGSDKKFTQADLDKIIGERLAKEREQHAARIKEIEENAGKTEVEKLTAERDKYKAEAENGGKVGAEKAARAEAKLTALTAGAKADRLAEVVKQADLSDVIGEDGEVDETKVKAAIDAVLTKFPEWKGTPGSSGGELGGGGGGDKPSFTRKQIQDMTPEERLKRLPEINEAMAAGRITG